MDLERKESGEITDGEGVGELEWREGKKGGREYWNKVKNVKYRMLNCNYILDSI